MSKKKETWYLMYRGWMESPVFKTAPYSQREAWCWLIENAAFEPLEVPSRVTGNVIELERGQLSHALLYLSNAWCWKGKSKAKRFLEKLEKRNMIEYKTEQGQSLITICNYTKYQERRSEGSTKGSTKSGTNKKELLKNDKELEKKLPDFIAPNSLEEFIQHRKSIKKPMTGKAVNILISKLKKFNDQGYDVNLMLEDAIMNGWQSVYEKPEHKRSTVPPVDTDFKNAWEERNKLFTESNFVSTQIEYLTLKESRTDKQEADLNELLTKRIGIEKRQEELQDYLSKLQRK